MTITLKNKKFRSKIFCFDLDNTICKTEKSNYSKSKPKKNVIKLINKLYDNGHIIKINTARYMGRNKDNIKKSNKQGFKKTIKQLKSWGLKFHKLAISKLSADIYIDDKSYGYSNKWKKEFKKFIK
tara:strand:- start:24 stop:401 length:378 start_codon:yes stop_codon:yes gene_type:complete